MGWVIRARATSTTLARPVGSSLTSRSATSPSPTSAIVRSVSALTSILPRRLHELRISPATRMLSRTLREVKSSSRW